MTVGPSAMAIEVLRESMIGLGWSEDSLLINALDTVPIQQQEIRTLRLALAAWKDAPQSWQAAAEFYIEEKTADLRQQLTEAQSVGAGKEAAWRHAEAEIERLYGACWTAWGDPQGRDCAAHLVPDPCSRCKALAVLEEPS